MTACPADEVGALAGFTVAVTAERRREELAALLRRRGARVVTASAITIVPLADDEALHAATAACIGLAPDLVIATTGFGFRGWLEAAEGWGLGDGLRSALRAARLIARGPKPCGAIRAAGLTEAWAAQTEATEEILRRLLELGVAGRRIAVQEHGEPQTEFVEALRAGGAAVVEVPVYRWTLPPDVAPVRRLVDQVVGRQVDAVTFTSARGAGVPGDRRPGRGPGVGQLPLRHDGRLRGPGHRRPADRTPGAGGDAGTVPVGCADPQRL